MTADKKFKKRVRDRMEHTGESYMAARHALLAGRVERSGPEPEPRLELPPCRCGSIDCPACHSR